ncbi:transcription factor PAR2-like [Cucurbita maxima]|uniref:Transcription factor PAR2-like n=1 Tax=Cucurbita maxima TaxID=3661 RepID=A0A6J1JLR0_CUCMA|nr:transcription factor PAR2-like [Cucurbita maxima]
MGKSQIQRLKLAIQTKRTTTPRHKALILNALHKSPLNRNARRRSRTKPTRIASGKAEEKEAVERKIRALQTIVPGGESLGVDKLFEQTAEYIMNLQHQVKAMRALSSFFESLEKEKSKCGGG